jgi:prepilin-type N-terminal cleavage/methylation domain-containing protein
MRRAARAFTLVELLTAIAVIGVLAALLLPAVQSAREAARRVQCQNFVKQLALGALDEHDAHGIFPSGGWGWYWLGDADRGYDRDQPGGWIYNVLPYIEQPALHELPRDGNRDAITDAQRLGARRMAEAPMPLLLCPSRRDRVVQSKPGAYYGNNCAAGDVARVASRTDYAINSGDRNWNETGHFPGSTSGSAPASHALADGFPWTWTVHGDVADPAAAGRAADMLLTGVSFQRSEVALRHVSDGASRTYLLGEKYLDPADYESGRDRSDNENWSTGWNNDNFRCAFDPPALNREFLSTKNCQTTIFGSSHAAGWMAAWCDGHVELMSFDLDLQVHRAHANRSDDGRPIAAAATCAAGAF